MEGGLQIVQSSSRTTQSSVCVCVNIPLLQKERGKEDREKGEEKEGRERGKSGVRTEPSSVIDGGRYGVAGDQKHSRLPDYGPDLGLCCSLRHTPHLAVSNSATPISSTSLAAATSRPESLTQPRTMKAARPEERHLILCPRTGSEFAEASLTDFIHPFGHT
ncbi:unnamed protein product [Pleuronectes platessa]|uniref:Uncharacterized protein n=1 Tax=Pleuronectes platessa TaxID=8262 RepID=A0A9N7Z5W4_PLEPL|nr:unnamed protein product [Pleuronectes platessa]